MATDWRQAGYRADAKRVLNLYRQSFDNDAKRLARERSVDALLAAGVQTVVCLWGGGLDAEALLAAGFRVIAVDNGSMEVTDAGRPVSQGRQKLALKYAAEAGGYEWRWGNVARFLNEADGALLDFHGPWARDKRLIIGLTRHMTAVVVVLMPSRDVSADASSTHERQMAYQLFLKMSWADKPRWESITANGHVRRLTDYHEDQGRHVFVYLLARRHIQIIPMAHHDRIKMRRDYRAKSVAVSASYYERHHDRIRQRDNDARRKGPFETSCTVCARSFETTHSNARYCSKTCRWSSRIRREKALRIPKPPLIETAICRVCLTPFITRVTGQRRTTCSPACRHSETKRRGREWARKYKAAVSGTAAKAISIEVAG